jgi:hypothetical protein
MACLDGSLKCANDAALDAAATVGPPSSRIRHSSAFSHFVPTQAFAFADVLLIAAGAGFSADSGLPVYDSIADDARYASTGITYSDLCNPLMMIEQPELFYGFWASCCNMYVPLGDL